MDITEALVGLLDGTLTHEQATESVYDDLLRHVTDYGASYIVWQDEYPIELTAEDGAADTLDTTGEARYILLERNYDGGYVSEYTLIPYEGEGIPGNMDPSIRRIHGWRGTTNNVSAYAMGVYKILDAGMWIDESHIESDVRRRMLYMARAHKKEMLDYAREHGLMSDKKEA